MTDPSTIQAMLQTAGITVNREEAERLGSALQAILMDLQKLDALDSELEEPAPRFIVEEHHDCK